MEKLSFVEVFRRAITDPNFVFDAPVSKIWGEYGDYQLAGHGEVTNEHCGEFVGMRGCTNVGAHNVTTLDGVNHAGKVPVRPSFRRCHRASCRRATQRAGFIVRRERLRLVCWREKRILV